MRALVVALLLSPLAVHADPLPSSAIGITTGAVTGLGAADTKRLGGGFYEFGAQASWQPNPSAHEDLTIRWATMFGLMYGGSASHVDTTLRTVEMDLTAGVRLRPWSSPSWYVTVRLGANLLRSNEPIPTDESMSGSRSYFRGVACIGVDHYVSIFMLNFDVRAAGLPLVDVRGGEPTVVSVMVGAAFAGPTR